MLADLIERLEKATGSDNALDVEIEVALFEPDAESIGARANSAGSKVIYTLADGTEVTYRAADWSIDRNKQRTLAILRAKEDRA